MQEKLNVENLEKFVDGLIKKIEKRMLVLVTMVVIIPAFIMIIWKTLMKMY
ncbi:MAG: hypothetical protein ACK5LC_14225 [Coprobacillaceae bacterium]